MMIRFLRIAAGLALVAGLLYLASLAVHDCTVGLHVYDNCVWMWVRQQTGLPPSKLLRALTLEIVGLALVAGLYVTVRYVFPRRQKAGGSG